MSKALELSSLWVPPVSDRPSRPEQIARVIADRINDQELKPGDKLPAETALAKHFGVSRAVVREAIARLKAEGLVETFQGSGGFVRAPEQPDIGLDPAVRTSVKSLLDLITVRRAIESEIAAAAAINRTDADLSAIEQAFQRLSEAEERNSDGVAEDCGFHAAIAAASANDYWIRITEALSRSIAIAIKVTRVNEARRRDFASEVHGEHGALVDAIRKRDPVAARAAAVQHMERAAARTMSAEQDFWKKGGAPVRDLGRQGPKAD